MRRSAPRIRTSNPWLPKELLHHQAGPENQNSEQPSPQRGPADHIALSPAQRPTPSPQQTQPAPPSTDPNPVPPTYPLLSRLVQDSCLAVFVFALFPSGLRPLLQPGKSPNPALEQVTPSPWSSLPHSLGLLCVCVCGGGAMNGLKLSIHSLAVPSPALSPEPLRDLRPRPHSQGWVRWGLWLGCCSFSWNWGHVGAADPEGLVLNGQGQA